MNSFSFIITFLIFSPFTNFACDCDGDEISAEEAVELSVKVFTGTVVSFKDELADNDGRKYFVTEFKIKEGFKGTQGQNIISIISETTDCGGDFQIGKSYLIYSFKNKSFNISEYHQCFKLALAEDKAKDKISLLRTISEN